MNSLAIFLCVIVAVAALPSGWGPTIPQVELNLSGDVLVTGTGSADASQALHEHAAGNAQVLSLNGVGGSLDQNGGVLQIGSADLSGSSPVTTTIQGVDGSSTGLATDELQAVAVASDDIQIQNSAQTDVQGLGSMTANANSINNVNSKKN